MKVRISQKASCLNNNLLIKGIILFGIEFNIRIYGGLSLRKIAFIILIISFLYGLYIQRERIVFSKEVVALFFSMVLLFVYTCVIHKVRILQYGSLLEGDAFLPRNILFLFLYIIIFPLLLIHFFKDATEFCRTQWYITLFQAVIAILGKLNHTFSLYIYNHFYTDDGRLLDEVMNGTRVVCIDIAGATASVIFFAGFICAIFIFFNDSLSNKYSLLFQYCFVLFSLFFIGRTGLYLGIIGLGLTTLCLLIRKKNKIFLWISCFMAVLLALLAGYVVFTPESSLKSHYVNWIGELFIKGVGPGSTFATIADMEIPRLTMETFWGTGIVYGVSGNGTAIYHDSGYVRLYAGLGIPGMILYYGSIYGFYICLLCKMRRTRNGWIFLFFLLGVALCEYKEPFLGKTPLLIIMTCLLICERDKNKLSRPII